MYHSKYSVRFTVYIHVGKYVLQDPFWCERNVKCSIHEKANKQVLSTIWCFESKRLKKEGQDQRQMENGDME